MLLVFAAALILAIAPSAIFYYRIRCGHRPKTWGNYVTLNIAVQFGYFGLMGGALFLEGAIDEYYVWILGILFSGMLAFGIVGLILLPRNYEDY